MSGNAFQREDRGRSFGFYCFLVARLLLKMCLSIYFLFYYQGAWLSFSKTMFPIGEWSYHICMKPCHYVAFTLWCSDRITESILPCVAQTECFHVRDKLPLWGEGKENFCRSQNITFKSTKGKVASPIYKQRFLTLQDHNLFFLKMTHINRTLVRQRLCLVFLWDLIIAW